MSEVPGLGNWTALCWIEGNLACECQFTSVSLLVERLTAFQLIEWFILLKSVAAGLEDPLFRHFVDNKIDLGFV